MSLRLPFARYVLALAAGGLGGFSQAPWDLAPLVLVPFLAGFYLFGARPFLVGWLIGTAYFAPTLGWITEPFQVDADLHGWMAPFALVGMSGGLALFWGMAFWLSARFGGVGALIFLWPLAEVARAYVFTGFPWAMAAQALVDTSAGQALAWIGPHGLTLAICALAWFLAHPSGRFTRPLPRMATAAVALAPILVPPLAPRVEFTEFTVRLVQPNAPQDEKWDPDRVPIFIERLIGGTAAPGDPDLVIWPETALPYLLEYADPIFADIARASGGTPVILGIQRRDAGDFYNSLVVLDPAGMPMQVYDKRHLVPFGEYMPFPGLFRRIGVRGLAERADTGFAAGESMPGIDLGPLGAALPLICYEAVFPHLAGAQGARPNLLVQITNDAWFGSFAGPQQHFAQARMRAIEQGLPLVRAANTGISAVIDPSGSVVAELPLGEAGVLDAPVPRPRQPTLYARMGDLPWIALMVFGVILLLYRRRQRGFRPVD